MWMSEGEIVSKYVRNGKDRGQIEILAELNATSKEAIKEILRKHDVLPERNSMAKRYKYEITDEATAKILELHNNGWSAPKISEELDVPIAAVRRTVKGVIPGCPNPVKSEELPSQNSAKEANVCTSLEMIDKMIANAEANLELMRAYREAVVKSMNMSA